MRGLRGFARSVSILLLVVGLIAGSFSLATAQEEDENDESDSQTTAETTETNDEEGAEVGTVTVTVTSNSLGAVPAGSIWSLFGTSDDGTIVDFGGEVAQEMPLPYEFVASTNVPYGTYTLQFNAGSGAILVTDQVTVEGANAAVTVELIPFIDSQLELNISSSDSAVTTMPEGSTWTISHVTGGVVTSGTFTGAELELPTTINLLSGLAYGDYLVSINATGTFAPYEQTHTVDELLESFNVVLDPYVPAAVPASLSVSLPNDAAGDVGLTWALDDAASQDNVAGGVDTYTLPTTLWTGELMPGTYWVSIYPDDGYAAISEQVTVQDGVPSANFDFELVQTGDPTPTATPDDPTPTATATPDDPTPTAAPEEPTPTATATEKPDHDDKDDDKERDLVKELPSTGQGAEPGVGTSVMVLVLAAVSLLLASIALRLRIGRADGR